MHPVLFKVGSIPVYSYSVFVVLAFFAGFLYAYLEARRIHEDPDKVVDLALYIFISAIIGARILHVTVEWGRYVHDPIAVFKIWQGGLVYYGGFILAIITCVVFIKYHKLELGKWSDLLAPVAVISLAIGRIGCFLNGCCYGKAAPPDLPWAVVYPPAHMPLHLAGVPLHPTPIYSSIAAAIIAGFLILLSRIKRYNGQVVWTMFLLYAATRFILEYFRGDPRGHIQALNLSTSQAIGIPIMIISAIALIYLEIKSRSSRACGKTKPEVP
jgi:phosphatidylglycerol:prolipoprotein diacylglycerol transferase